MKGDGRWDNRTADFKIYKPKLIMMSVVTISEILDKDTLTIKSRPLATII